MSSYVLVLFLCVFTVFGQGIITGVVSGSDGVPIPGATVLIEDTPFGTMTNSEGEYVIPAVEPGVYSLTARMVGRSAETVQGVSVENDAVSRIDFELMEDVSGATVIRVVESRSHVLRDVPSTVFVLDFSEMKVLTSGGLIDVVAEQPGVSSANGDLHVRGGRAGELDYMLDGVSLRSPMDNRLGIDLPASSVSNATLITGGMGIEFGNSMSGVVDLLASEGEEEFTASVSGRMGDVTSMTLPSEVQVFSESIDRDLCRTGLSGFEFSLSGRDPVSSMILPAMGLPGSNKISFSFSGQMNFSGTGTDTRGNWSNNWLNDASGVVKAVYKPSPGDALSLSLLGSYRETGWNQWAWSEIEERSCVGGVACPPGNLDYVLPAMYSETEGAVLNAGTLLGEKAHLELTLGAMRFLNWNRIYSADGGYVGEGEGYLYWLDEYMHPDLISDSLGFYRKGIHRNVWFDSGADVFNADCGLDWNLGPRFRLKAGIGAKYYDLYQYNVYCLSGENSYLSLWNAYPHSGNAYLQGTIRFTGGGIVTVGARGDYFDPNTTVFSLESDSAMHVDPKIHISPRASFSVPFGERSVFFTTYGHYFQLAPMNCYYLQTVYTTGADRVVAGNPDLDAELTTMYEVGIRHEIDRFSDVALSFYFKDMSGLISTESHSEGGYFVFSNDDSHGSATGIETSVSRRQGENLSGQLFYSYSTAEGRYSDMLEEWNLSQSGSVVVLKEDNPLDWDQPHKAGVSMEYRFFGNEGGSLAGVYPLENTAFNLSWSYASGMPYTVVTAGGEPVEVNGERRPYTMQTDLSIAKVFHSSLGNIALNFSVFNLFNRRNLDNIYDTTIYHDTGSPGGVQGNPRAWSPARHFLVAATITW